ncbi:MAG: response regulator [Planctomycetota bacterium]
MDEVDSPLAALRVLICEDSPEDAEIMLFELGQGGFDIVSHQVVERLDAFESALRQEPFDIVLSDFTMPGFGAMQALSRLRELQGEMDQEIPFLVVTGSIDEETAVDSLKMGADDYILKENLTRLVPAVHHVMDYYAERRERMLLEAQLRHAQRMEAFGRMSAGIAQDFNNLLTVIMGYGGLAEAESRDAGIQSHMRCILGASETARQMTTQLLAFGSRSPSAPGVVEVGAVLKSARELLAGPMMSSVQVRADIRGKGRILVDAAALEQAFVNVMLNARDAMHDGGTLQLRVRDATLHALAAKRLGVVPGSYVCIEFEDDGAGISPDVLPHVFDPFFTTKDADSGSGLGLSTTFGTVHQFGGSIEVESRLGEGALFRIYLPQTLVQAEALVASVGETGADAVDAPSRQLLVIESEEVVRTFIARSLRNDGYEVTEASNSAAAVRLADESSAAFDLVICDMLLPSAAGDELRSQLRTCDGSVPFLFTSGYGDYRHHAALGEAASCLPKPFSPNELTAKVRQMLSRKSAGDTVT